MATSEFQIVLAVRPAAVRPVKPQVLKPNSPIASFLTAVHLSRWAQAAMAAPKATTSQRSHEPRGAAEAQNPALQPEAFKGSPNAAMVLQ